MKSRRSSNLVPWLVISGLGVVLVLLVVNLAISTSDSEPESDHAAASELESSESPQTPPESPSEGVVSVTNPIPASSGAPPEKPEEPRESPPVEDNRPIIMRGFRIGMTLDDAIAAEKEYGGSDPIEIFEDLARWEVKFLQKQCKLSVNEIEGRIEECGLATVYPNASESITEIEMLLGHAELLKILKAKYGEPSEAIEADVDAYTIWEIAESRPWKVTLMRLGPDRTKNDTWVVGVRYESAKANQYYREREEKDRSSL